jgi:hypothetical protein
MTSDSSAVSFMMRCFRNQLTKCGRLSGCRGDADIDQTGQYFRFLMSWTAPTLRLRSAIGWLRLEQPH